MAAHALVVSAPFVFVLAQSGCGGSVEQGHGIGGRGVAGSRSVAGSSAGGWVSSGGAGGEMEPYTPGPHGGPNQPCYPNATCAPGFLCTSSFVCVFDPRAAGSAGTAGLGGGGGSFAGAAAEAGAGPKVMAFCDPNAVPVQPRAPLPFTVTSAFIGSGWRGNPDAIRHFDCAPGDRAPGAVGFCDGWSYASAVADPFVAVAYVRAWDANYTHPPVCLESGADFVEFYAKGALGGEVILAGAEGGGEFSFTLTSEWSRYRIPMAGVDYAVDPTGVELGFQWILLPPELGALIPATAFQVDSIRWVKEAASTSGDAGAGGELNGGEAGAGGG